jgi:putative flippase GtrA
MASVKNRSTFVRSLLAGGVATIVDLAVLAFATGVLHLDPRVANVPGLLAGAVVQFLANRHFAFGAASGSLRRQATGFALAETAALALNAVLYHLVASAFPLGVLAALGARAITTNAVYLGFSYPIWKRVFRPMEEAR